MKFLWTLSIAAALGVAAPAQGQSTGDWIQILVMDYEKLTELRGIVTDMKTGYVQIKAGYEAVKSIAAANFNLHQLFLDALLALSPPVQQYYKISEIVSAETRLVQQSRSAMAYWRGSGRLTAAELVSIEARYASVLARSEEYVRELTMVLTGGALRMSDADRIGSIDRVHAGVTGELQWMQGLNDRIGVQVLQRAHEAGNIQSLQQLYGIPTP